MLPILVLMIDSDRFVTNFGPKNHATWPFLSMPWAVIRGWAIIQVWAINREFTVFKFFQQKLEFFPKSSLGGLRLFFALDLRFAKTQSFMKNSGVVKKGS